MLSRNNFLTEKKILSNNSKNNLGSVSMSHRKGRWNLSQQQVRIWNDLINSNDGYLPFNEVHDVKISTGPEMYWINSLFLQWTPIIRETHKFTQWLQEYTKLR